MEKYSKIKGKKVALTNLFHEVALFVEIDRRRDWWGSCEVVGGGDDCGGGHQPAHHGGILLQQACGRGDGSVRWDSMIHPSWYCWEKKRLNRSNRDRERDIHSSTGFESLSMPLQCTKDCQRVGFLVWEAVNTGVRFLEVGQVVSEWGSCWMGRLSVSGVSSGRECC